MPCMRGQNNCDQTIIDSGCELLQILLNTNCNIDLQDDKCDTPLHYYSAITMP